MEIIPKYTKKLLPWQNILFYFSLFLLIAVIFGYFFLISLENKSLTALQDLEEEIAKTGTKEERALEVGVFANQREIKDFSILLSEHQKASNFFDLLERACHPGVWLTDLELNLKASKAVVSGKSLDFQTVGQQLFILQGQSSIRDINLSDLSIGEDGGTEFTLSFSLDPKIFK